MKDIDADIDVPDEINGVPIYVEKGVKSEPISTCYIQEPDCDDYDGTCLQGGSFIQYNDWNWFQPFTLGFSGERNGEPRFATVAHGFAEKEDYCSRDIDGFGVQDRNCTVVGTVSAHWWWSDVAFLDISDTKELDNTVIPFPDVPVIGHVTKQGVIDLRDTGKTCDSFGQTTCRTRGPIKDITTESWCSYGVEYVEADIDVDVGDLGGPLYLKIAPTQTRID